MSTDTEDRLARIEARLAKVEDAISRAETMFKTFAEGPGKKILGMFGAQLP